ncbi:hypothetical protein BD770DRAFT_391219 [Pilaira anomala]|nr:hypothetical protein BD770DRAFT_391219 [Pilaira anomala]
MGRKEKCEVIHIIFQMICLLHLFPFDLRNKGGGGLFFFFYKCGFLYIAEDRAEQFFFTIIWLGLFTC